MTEIMTSQNVIIGGIAISALRFIAWRYWFKPRRAALMRKMIREEIDAGGWVHQ